MNSPDTSRRRAPAANDRSARIRRAAHRPDEPARSDDRLTWWMLSDEACDASLRLGLPERPGGARWVRRHVLQDRSRLERVLVLARHLRELGGTTVDTALRYACLCFAPDWAPPR